MKSPVLVIGLGNWMRCDDGAGLEVVRRLAATDGFAVRAHEGEAVGLLDLWAGSEAVVLVDAVHSGSPPGTIHRFDASSHPLQVTLQCASSHAIGPAEAIELARAMGTLPASVIFYGLQGAGFSAGTTMSPPVIGAISKLVELVRTEAQRLAATCSRSRGS